VTTPRPNNASDGPNTVTYGQSQPEIDSTKSSAPPQNVAKTRITISDNLSTDDEKKNRRLLALKPKTTKLASTANPDTSGEVLDPL
jgi:hypothetical protein